MKRFIKWYFIAAFALAMVLFAAHGVVTGAVRIAVAVMDAAP